MGRPEIIVAGGGVGGLETVLSLALLAGDRVGITLVTAEPSFTELPEAVDAPFTGRAPAQHLIADLVGASGATIIVDRVAEVRTAERQVILASGAERSYDALVLALGVVAVPAYPDAVTFDPRHPESVRDVIGELEAGTVSRLAVVVPPGHHWTLPAYELALHLARCTPIAGGGEVEILLAIPERAPLAAFGPGVTEAAERLLAEAGVAVRTGTFVELRPGVPVMLVTHPGGVSRPVDRVVAVPRLEPVPVPGLGAGRDGFLAVDGFGRVYGLSDIYAVGDMTRHPIKQGGLAAQQAHAAAEHLAARFGASVRPAPFTPVLRGRLRVPGGDRWIQDDPDHPGAARVADHPLWWPPGKLAGGELAAELARRATAATA